MNHYQKALETLSYKEVTLWFCNSEYNHLELGHQKEDRPRGDKPQNKAWNKNGWSKQFSYMKEQSVLC